MKILYLIPSLCHSGGMERILTAKANWLVTHGYTVTIITTEKHESNPFFQINENINIVNFNVDFNSHVNKPLLYKIFYHIRKIKTYRKKLDDFLSKQPHDIIISLCGKEIEFISSYKKISRVYAELHFTKNYKELSLTSKKSIIHNLLNKYLSFRLMRHTRRLDALIVLTPTEKELWSKCNRNVIQIYNALPLKSKKHVIATTDARAIAVGQLLPVKGFDMLIKAWEIVHNAIPSLKLDIYGDGYLKNELLLQIRAANLEDTVTLKGTSTHIQEELERSSLYVMSSRNEGFPMILIEAAAAGLPIISYDCPTGPREIIEHNVSGLLVPPNDIDQLANCIITLANDINLQQRLSENIAKRYADFDFEKIMRQWDAIFMDNRTNH